MGAKVLLNSAALMRHVGVGLKLGGLGYPYWKVTVSWLQERNQSPLVLRFGRVPDLMSERASAFVQHSPPSTTQVKIDPQTAAEWEGIVGWWEKM